MNAPVVPATSPPRPVRRGLADAVRALALDSPVRTQVTGSLDARPPAPVESAAKLELQPSDDDNRRVLAVLAYLGEQ